MKVLLLIAPLFLAILVDGQKPNQSCGPICSTCKKDATKEERQKCLDMAIAADKCFNCVPDIPCVINGDCPNPMTCVASQCELNGGPGNTDPSCGEICSTCQKKTATAADIKKCIELATVKDKCWHCISENLDCTKDTECPLPMKCKNGKCVFDNKPGPDPNDGCGGICSVCQKKDVTQDEIEQCIKDATTLGKCWHCIPDDIPCNGNAECSPPMKCKNGKCVFPGCGGICSVCQKKDVTEDEIKQCIIDATALDKCWHCIPKDLPCTGDTECSPPMKCVDGNCVFPGCGGICSICQDPDVTPAQIEQCIIDATALDDCWHCIPDPDPPCSGPDSCPPPKVCQNGKCVLKCDPPKPVCPNCDCVPGEPIDDCTCCKGGLVCFAVVCDPCEDGTLVPGDECECCPICITDAGGDDCSGPGQFCGDGDGECCDGYHCHDHVSYDGCTVDGICVSDGTAGEEECGVCGHSHCHVYHHCHFGHGWDHCHCCDVCLHGPGDHCGGPNNYYGECGEGFHCSAYADSWDGFGECAC